MALTERFRGFTVSQVLAHQASEAPDRIFVRFGDDEFTYGEVEEDVQALAAALANLGIEAGDRVAIILPGCSEFVVALFALARMGAVAVPLNPRLTEPELQYMLRHSETVCAVTIETFGGVDYLQRFESLFPNLPGLQYLATVGEEDLWYDDRIFQFEDLVSAGRGRSFVAPEINPEDDSLALVYTSGTTGKPKGVELTHGNLVHVAAATSDVLGLTSDDRVVGVTALFHVFGLGPGIIGTAMAGASLILQEEFDAALTLDLVEAWGATVHHGVPTVFISELHEQRRTARDLSTLRTGIVAGAPMPEEVLRAVQEELCQGVLTAYSLTEAASTFAITRPEDPAEKRRYTVGRPIEGSEVRVLESDGTPLPVESLGELAVAGPGVMKGYYRQPRETAGALDAEGFLRTGDLGIVDEEGYLHLVGRRKEVIIRGGFNVHPREVEDRLHAHPAVRDAAVVGVPDEILGETICAAVVPVEGAIVTGEELRTWCGRTLADHKVPDEVRFMDALPMTATGKVHRVELARILEGTWSG
jgi:fatty-acyl-CoA synthase